MFNLDVRSVILVAGALSLLMAMVLFFLRRSFPPSIRGLGEWAAGPAVIFVATLLFGARGVIPDLFSVLLANLLLLGGAAMLYFGSQRFFGLPPSIRLWGVLILLALLVLAWFALVRPHYGVRVAIVGAMMTLLSLLHARLILQRGTRDIGSYVAGGALLLLALSQAMRCVSAFDLAAGDRILDNTLPMQTAFVTINAFTILMTTIGMVLMATDKLRSELEHLATHDSLTGILNRRAMIEACTLELARCRRNHHVMALLVIDLDHFKAINDTHGHQMGDRVLIDFVARVAPLLRQPDRLGRFGGEEFVVLLPETSLDEARIVAERIRSRIAAEAAGLPNCTASIGVTISRVDDADLDDIIARADTALYQAKNGGRNRVEAVAQLEQ